MGILAGCWYFDWSGPVEVEVAKCVRQLLNVELGQGRVILGHEEVRWEHTTLGGRSWRHVEVKLLAVTGSIVLHETFVDDAARWRIG